MAASFGADLKDQLQAIDKYSQNGQLLANELRDFLKERAQIEKEYGHRLEQLSKKYSQRKEKLGPQIMDLPANYQPPVGVPFNGSDKYGTLYRAWDALLLQTEEHARTKQLLHDQITARVTDPLKLMLQKKDDARRKHLLFSQKLQDDKQRAVQGIITTFKLLTSKSPHDA